MIKDYTEIGVFTLIDVQKTAMNITYLMTQTVVPVGTSFVASASVGWSPPSEVCLASQTP